MILVRRILASSEWVLVGALTVFLSFNAGGYFPTAPALAALALALALVLRVTLVEDPFAGISPALALAAGGLGLLAVWQLASALWSDAPARALLEFDRTLLYLLALIFFGSLAGSAERLRRIGWGVAIGFSVAAASALITRLAPEVWPTDPQVANDRLSFPLTYWNALGLACALGIVLCLHAASSTREPRLARVLGAAAVPMLATALYLTLSRGAIVAGAVGVLAYMLLGRPRALILGLVATVVPAVLALRAGYEAPLLSTRNPTTPQALEQGRALAGVLGLAMLGAATLRAALIPLDSRLAGLRISRRSARLAAGAAAALAVVVAIAAASAFDLPARASDGFERFVAGNSLDEGADVRRRLTEVGNNGRLFHWRVALDAYGDEPVTGFGAATYHMLWAQRRPSTFSVQDAHSLYLEVMAELGLVGLVLLAIALGPLLLGMAWRARGADRAIHAALLRAALAWAVHAGIDWDWEMPAVTLWLFCAGGAALSAGARAPGRLAAPGRRTRMLAGLGILILAVTPALVAISERRLDRSVEAFQAGRCPQAVEAALGSLAVVSVRPDPWQILGYCDVRLGARELAVGAMQNAVDRDPRDWELRYGLAIVRGAAGLDPRPQLRVARMLNPRERLLREAADGFDTDDSRTWRRRAESARLPRYYVIPADAAGS